MVTLDTNSLTVNKSKLCTCTLIERSRFSKFRIVKLKMNTESWCSVEKMPSQDWKRAQRGHDDKAMKSTVFVKEKLVDEGRLIALKVHDMEHKQRRHFAGKRRYLRM